VTNEADVVQPSFRPPVIGESVTVDGQSYLLGDAIGRGYFGTVYECSDEWGNALAAKVLVPRNQTYEEVHASWQAELQKLLFLRHPNITYIHAAFEFKHTFYLVMERCSMDLNTVINLESLTADGWIPHVARDVLQALEYIHSNGYVHKDIHPGNVFVSQTQDRMVPSRDAVWSFKVGDLGISRLESEINVLNTMLAAWMLPPEAIDAQEFGSVGRTVDIYHVALLLLALLLNQTPTFTRDEILQGRPRELAEQSGSRFGPAIARALRRHVAARTPSALHFWREIDAAAKSVL